MVLRSGGRKLPGVLRSTVSANGLAELNLHAGKTDEPCACAWLELDEDVHVAVRAEVVTEDRAEYRQTADPVSSAEGREVLAR